MIANALTFINKQLNEHFKNALQLDHAMVVVSRMTDPNIDGKLVITLVDIETETSVTKPSNIKGVGNEFARTAPPLHLNLHILISVEPRTPYVEGMKHLSQAITFFNEQPYFVAAQTKMPEGIDKITIEMMRLDTNTKTSLWQSLGANYQPSVIYKMRLISSDSKPIKGVIPAVAKPK